MYERSFFIQYSKVRGLETDPKTSGSYNKTFTTKMDLIKFYCMKHKHNIRPRKILPRFSRSGIGCVQLYFGGQAIILNILQSAFIWTDQSQLKQTHLKREMKWNIPCKPNAISLPPQKCYCKFSTFLIFSQNSNHRKNLTQSRETNVQKLPFSDLYFHFNVQICITVCTVNKHKQLKLLLLKNCDVLSQPQWLPLRKKKWTKNKRWKEKHKMEVELN